MYRFISRRLLQVIPLLLAVTLISFGVMQLAPGNYLDTLRGQPTIRPETIEKLQRDFGLDKPWPVQYAKWLGNAVRGDFGYSFTYKIQAATLIKQRLYYTFLLSLWSTIFSWSIAIPIGIYIATHRNGIVDRIANIVAFAGISLPGFFMALLAMLYAQRTGHFPVGGATSVDYESMSHIGKILDTAKHMVLPVLILGIGGIAGLMRQMRGNVLEILSEQYIMAARARGLSERKVIYKHALRNAINPLITLFGYTLSGLLAGAALVENVMAWPGLGRLLLESVQNRDLYVAMASFVMGTVLLILGNLVADVLLALSDPRIKFS
ncbi:ABC transporter permease [bacterium]|nr:MAG: ABC transporter permease [bacterium]